MRFVYTSFEGDCWESQGFECESWDKFFEGAIETVGRWLEAARPYLKAYYEESKFIKKQDSKFGGASWQYNPDKKLSAEDRKKHLDLIEKRCNEYTTLLFKLEDVRKGFLNIPVWDFISQDTVEKLYKFNLLVSDLTKDDFNIDGVIQTLDEWFEENRIDKNA